MERGVLSKGYDSHGGYNTLVNIYFPSRKQDARCQIIVNLYKLLLQQNSMQ